ncbi:PPOX class F420-dependent oxidoreductase [Sinosporangium siamense]|uniref:PPOX class F420-dependent oxidoreductase n=1 Tax=Sinosporangium siamense TaxID=1367973 RepID=A0A919RI91_9ACTN|nr:PPOX class F420-dependent oxidoreductase [Sinosporangium siamense]GII94371.1 PPOX class F420-dependent oxidoreductase [Sinosporangium siamense]
MQLGSWDAVAAARYAMITTYRKDGTPVGVPVWLAPDGDRIVIWTVADSWKVKRIRRNPEVALQICDTYGTKTTGEIVHGRASVQDGAATKRTRAVVGRKYGLIGLAMIYVSRFARGADATVGLTIEPA